ncbi:MAG: hypothetical protein K2K64_03200 [Muribaculaceae bacterium]|nr:hypothetical protein [Muribaculaceae bacterium]MDE7109703.1 hypothetical protein [Muribaculaceae bacterium]
MIASVIVWVAVAAILMIVLVARIVSEQRRSLVRPHVSAGAKSPRRHIIELGKEREEFFAAGDSELIPGDDYDMYYNS